jgi:hypothetical protein
LTVLTDFPKIPFVAGRPILFRQAFCAESIRRARAKAGWFSNWK